MRAAMGQKARHCGCHGEAKEDAKAARKPRKRVPWSAWADAALGAGTGKEEAHSSAELRPSTTAIGIRTRRLHGKNGATAGAGGGGEDTIKTNDFWWIAAAKQNGVVHTGVVGHIGGGDNNGAGGGGVVHKQNSGKSYRHRMGDGAGGGGGSEYGQNGVVDNGYGIGSENGRYGIGNGFVTCGGVYNQNEDGVESSAGAVTGAAGHTRSAGSKSRERLPSAGIQGNGLPLLTGTGSGQRLRGQRGVNNRPLGKTRSDNRLIFRSKTSSSLLEPDQNLNGNLMFVKVRHGVDVISAARTGYTHIHATRAASRPDDPLGLHLRNGGGSRKQPKSPRGGECELESLMSLDSSEHLVSASLQHAADTSLPSIGSAFNASKKPESSPDVIKDVDVMKILAPSDSQRAAHTRQLNGHDANTNTSNCDSDGVTNNEYHTNGHSDSAISESGPLEHYDGGKSQHLGSDVHDLHLQGDSDVGDKRCSDTRLADREGLTSDRGIPAGEALQNNGIKCEEPHNQNQNTVTDGEPAGRNANHVANVECETEVVEEKEDENEARSAVGNGILKPPVSVEKKIKDANLSLSSFFCVKVIEDEEDDNEEQVDDVDRQHPSLSHNAAAEGDPDPSVADHDATVGGELPAPTVTKAKRRSVRFTDQNQVLEYHPWAAIDGDGSDHEEEVVPAPSGDARPEGEVGGRVVGGEQALFDVDVGEREMNRYSSHEDLSVLGKEGPPAEGDVGVGEVGDGEDWGGYIPSGEDG